MRRVFAYLMKHRRIDREAVAHFVKTGTLYEDAEYHNAVFVGTDGNLYVFEAPIDLLSYITLHPEGWEDHSYVACCGTSAIPVTEMLRRMDAPQTVFLCLDNDKAGQEADQRIEEQIKEKFGVAVERIVPKLKDWNENLCAMREKPDMAMQMR